MKRRKFFRLETANCPRSGYQVVWIFKWGGLPESHQRRFVMTTLVTRKPVPADARAIRINADEQHLGPALWTWRQIRALR